MSPWSRRPGATRYIGEAERLCFFRILDQFGSFWLIFWQGNAAFALDSRRARPHMKPFPDRRVP
jgi:hypothetical protein